MFAFFPFDFSSLAGRADIFQRVRYLNYFLRQFCYFHDICLMVTDLLNYVSLANSLSTHNVACVRSFLMLLFDFFIADSTMSNMAFSVVVSTSFEFALSLTTVAGRS